MNTSESCIGKNWRDTRKAGCIWAELGNVLCCIYSKVLVNIWKKFVVISRFYRSLGFHTIFLQTRRNFEANFHTKVDLLIPPIKHLPDNVGRCRQNLWREAKLRSVLFGSLRLNSLDTDNKIQLRYKLGLKVSLAIDKFF